MNSNNKSKQFTLNYTEVDPSRISFTELKENDRSLGQKIAYPRYNHPKLGANSDLIIQLPWIKITQGGIPRIDKYHADDSKRGYIKLPLDQSIPEIKEFSDMLRSIDAVLGSSENKQMWFGSQANKYEYTSLFRIPEEEDPEESKTKKNQGPKLPYMKVKLDTTYPENHVKTVIFKSVMKDGKRERSLVDDITDIDSLCKTVSYMSTVRPIIRPVKLWSASNKTKSYGLSFKVLKMEVEPSEKSTSILKEYMNDADTFLDDDSDTAVEHVASEKITKQVAKVDSDDETPAPKQVEKRVEKQVAQVAQVDSDDDESDDEPVVPVKGKKPVKVESDDDESDDEPVVPVKGKKPPVKVESDDESDDEPKAKSKAKASATKGKTKK